MIDAKKINLILLSLFIILTFSPTLLLAILAGLSAIICAAFLFLRLSALSQFRSYPKIQPTSYQPFVTVIIACANEPHLVMEKTLKALSRLDYEDYQVLVLDNNNANFENWQNIKTICDDLGCKFKFFHQDHVAGYKAGALNLAYHHMHPLTEIVAVVDADYVVEPNFLGEMTRYFIDPNVAIVQAPQDYFHRSRNPGLYANYRTFFSVYMNQSQLLDTVTFTGTMGLLRKSLFDRDLKWNEWCITEDTEAGVYIHALGYAGVYLDRSFGRGMMPLSYESLIKQRSRWSYGNMQIILKNFWPMVRNRNFSLARKLGFLTQLIAWIRLDLVIFIILAANVVQRILLWRSDLQITNMKILLSILIYSALFELVFFALGLNEKYSLKDKIFAYLVQYGLTFTMSYSWLYMLLGGKLGFLVTTKSKEQLSSQHLNGEVILPFLIILLIGLLLYGGYPPFLIVPLSVLFFIELAGVMYLIFHFGEAI